MPSLKPSPSSSVGLSREELKALQNVFSKYPEIESVVLFGSRAMNTHKHGSDVDLLLRGKKIDFGTVANVHGDLADTTLPYFFDVLSENTLESPELKEHVRRFGVVVYSLE